MASDFVRVAKDVLSNKNILVIALTTSLISITDMGWRPFWGLYLTKELGASIAAVGLLSTIASSENLLFQLPGGLLADKYGRRKIIIFGTALRFIPPLIYLRATDWTQVIPALLVNGATSIYMPAFNAIIADSLPEEERGAGYGAYRTITSSPQIFGPIIGGVLMDSFGYREGVRIFLIVSLFTNIFVTFARWKILTETLDVDRAPVSDAPKEKQTLKQKIGSTFELPRTIWVMVLVAILGSFGMRLVWDFMSIYAVEIIGLSNTQLGLVQTTGGIVAAILAMPGGMMSDKFGRKPMILVSRITSPIATAAVTLAATFNQYFLIQFVNSIGNSLGGGGMYAGGPAWNALIADLVPREKRGTVMGTIGTVSGIVATPSSIIGGYLWQTFSPQFPFYVSVVLGLIGALVFAIGVKEPKRPEKVKSLSSEPG
ncbi:MAG TPA: MFS transporter [Patescibacteria group bacterium]|nr:MFS transporter [Patescibacteria group bacterium]